MGKDLFSLEDDIALAHRDERRTIYEPERILRGLEDLGPWYAHNIIKIDTSGLKLGKHFHDYHEVFFTPTGGFFYSLVDMEDLDRTGRVELAPGQRLVIPPNVGHVVTAEEGSVIMGYGNAEFNPKKLIPCTEEALKVLESL